MAMAASERVDFAKQRARLEESLARLRSQPERPQRGGPRVTVRVLQDRLCEAQVDGHTFLVDEPVERGGTGQAPSAMGYFVSGAAACLTSQLTQYAALLDVPFSDLTVEAEMAWDNRHKWGVVDLGHLTQGFVFRVAVTSPASPERVIELLRRAEEGCYASDALRNAIPMRAELRLNGATVHTQGVNGEVPEFPTHH
jgi:uncharacterized OsmC-like protein